MASRPFKIASLIVAATLLLLVAIGGYAVMQASAYPTRKHAGDGALIDIDIPRNRGIAAIASLLASKKVIERPQWFRYYVMWEGKTTEIKAGSYKIANNLTPKQVLSVLIAGVKEETVKVTLPEGKNMLEFFEILDAANVAKYDDLAELAFDQTFMAKFSIVGDSLEGYLFPDTYEFRIGDKASAVLTKLVTKHREVWNDVAKQHGKGLADLKTKLKWTDRDTLVLASIVEKEAVDPLERPRIAQVFVNRLTWDSFKSKRLETDPTIRYGCMVPKQKSQACQAWDKSDRLHRAQLDDVDNKYNTYRHAGLPPGPISNPGRGSMAAVMNPDGSEFLFFVAKDARHHVFSRTVEEHEKAVDKYIRGK